MRRRLVILIALGLLLCGCTRQTAAERTFFSMDTVMTLRAYGENAQDALTEAQKEIERLDGALSATDAGSDLYAVNGASGETVTVSETTAAALAAALEATALTDGAVQITVYPAVTAWGFPTGEYEIPMREELARLAALVDDRAVELDAEACTVRLPEGMQLDLGAVAKGYASDVACDLLRSRGVSSAILSLGGNICCLGCKPDGSDWTVGVRDPKSDGLIGTLSVRDVCVVTSGGYERYFERDGVVYWHILDPKTCAPARSGVLSATAVGVSGTLCDVMSTALFVLGRDGARELYGRVGGFEYVLVLEDGQIVLSPGLADVFTPAEGQNGVIVESAP